MEVLYPRCAGLDVHKDVVVACVRCVSTPVQQEARSFRTTTSGLLSLAEWLNSCGCTHVAMERRMCGIFWKRTLGWCSPTPRTSRKHLAAADKEVIRNEKVSL